MRTAKRVIENPHVVIRSVRCTDDRVRWSEPEASHAAQIVLVRRGHFQVESQGRRVTVEPATGYLHRAGEELRFAHPAGGDVCTAVTFVDDELTAGLDAAPSPAIHVDARLELAHRMLLRAGPDPDVAAVEAVLDLLRLSLRGRLPATPAPGREDLANRAKETILADEPAGAGLVALARLLRTSPSHLSRTFRHHAGMPLSRYRNRVRVSRALTALEQGETDLAALAVRLGFNDQAHLTRVMRGELGHTPGRVRTLLARQGYPLDGKVVVGVSVGC
ncbi:helix-turn-helix transcriptional regulator [Nonomuraea maheshkhaliensis]|uniref:Helix-turn-helix transcriptional regulator n=1 Tax=Nonomuraea maheshkhaliensis TaxID=419590 RepID=A0ABN2GRM8_9ACTN